MTFPTDEHIGRALVAWVDATRRRPRRALAAIAAATVVILVYASGHIGMRGDTDALFSPDLPFKQRERSYHEAFPMLYENMFVVIDGVTPERAGEAAGALANRLAAETEVFHTVYLPGGGEFFDQHAFLYLDTEQLEDLADRLAEAQPYLAELSRDGTLRGLASIMARGGRAVREGDVSGVRLGSMFDRFGEALDARLEGRPFHLSWAEVLASGRFEGGARRRFLLVQPILDFHELQPAKRAILAVRRIAEELGLGAESGVSVRITGDVALSYEEMESVRGQAIWAGAASFVLVSMILGIALRSAILTISTMLTLVVGLIWTSGFTALAIGHFNLISVSFAVLFIGLGVDFGIHLCTRYRELMGQGFDHAESLRATARDVGSSIVLCAATTGIGFLAFVPTAFVGVAELGLISAAGMFISLFLTLTLLPALVSLRPLAPGVPSRGGTAWSGEGLTALPVRYPRAVRATALVLGIGAVFLLPKARFDNNPLNVRDPSTESVRTFNDLLEKGTTSPWTLGGVAPDLETAEALAERIRELDEVERVVTVATYVPSDQEEKLGIIEDVAMFLAPPPGSDGTVMRPSTEEQLSALRDLESAAARLAEADVSDEFTGSAQRLERALHRYLAFAEASEKPDEEIAALEASLLASLPEQLRTLNAALDAGRVTLENLPGALLEWMVTSDGRVRIQVFPSQDLNDNRALAAFVDGVRELMPGAAGSAAEILESGRAVVNALRQAMFSAVVAITLFLLILWRRLDDTALVLIPLGLASVLTVAAAVLADIPFNFADVIVLPLLLGIGIDSGIHLVRRAHLSGDRELNLLGTSTARAVVFSGLTTIASFGTLGFSTHQGMATLGQLLTLGVGFTILCNLIVLPSLIALRPRSRVAPSAPEASARAK